MTTIKMTTIKNAIMSGFIATFVVGSILLMKNAMKLFPDIHIAQTLSTIIGQPDHIVWGGVTFVLAGTVLLGLVYAWLAPRVPVRSRLIKGIVFGFIVWLLMMLILMPVAGAGIFGLHRSAVVPAFDLVITLIYGLVLAAMYTPDPGIKELANTDKLAR
jgi:hypothetical protein